MEQIERVIHYIGELDPAFPDQVQGASPSQVLELSTLVNAELPATYQQFLLSMGENMDWLSIQGADFNLSRLLDRYRRMRSRPLNGYVLAGLLEDEAGYDVYLQEDGSPWLRVVALPELTDATEIGTWIRPIAGSLEQGLCTAAFRTVRFDILPAAITFSSRGRERDLFGPASASLEDLSMDKLWYSNDRYAVLTRGDTAAIVAEPIGAPFSLEMRGSNQQELEAISATLLSHVPLVRQL
jgi:hypothetical protein